MILHVVTQQLLTQLHLEELELQLRKKLSMNRPTPEQINSLGPVPKDLAGFQQLSYGTITFGDLLVWACLPSPGQLPPQWADGLVGVPVPPSGKEPRVYRKIPCAGHVIKTNAELGLPPVEGPWATKFAACGLELLTTAKGHNPRRLTNAAVETNLGYRLLDPDEITRRSRSHPQIEAWSTTNHCWNTSRNYGDISSLAYRTKLTREQLAALDPKTRKFVAPQAENTFAREVVQPAAKAAPAPKSFIPQDDQRRKNAPMFRGLLGYFPAALFAVAEHSQESDQKHNPGNVDGPHWARDKSSDHADCIPRHLVDAGTKGTPDRKYHLRALAWRALALLQEECEAEGAAPGVSSRFPSAK